LNLDEELELLYIDVVQDLVREEFARFYTIPRRLKLLNEEGLSPEDFDFHPES
jgi:hypothetical protein